MEPSSAALGKRRSKEPDRLVPDDDAAQRGSAHSAKKPKDDGPEFIAGLEEFITEERETKTERNTILEAAGKRAEEKDPKPERPS